MRPDVTIKIALNYCQNVVKLVLHKGVMFFEIAQVLPNNLGYF